MVILPLHCIFTGSGVNIFSTLQIEEGSILIQIRSVDVKKEKNGKNLNLHSVILTSSIDNNIEKDPFGNMLR